MTGAEARAIYDGLTRALVELGNADNGIPWGEMPQWMRVRIQDAISPAIEEIDKVRKMAAADLRLKGQRAWGTRR